MLGKNNAFRKLAMVSVCLLAAFTFKAFAVIDPGGGYFCKNDPTKNTGKCYVWATGASCDNVNSNSNKDCYATGQD
jgi:hypothetical protein